MKTMNDENSESVHARGERCSYEFDAAGGDVGKGTVFLMRYLGGPVEARRAFLDEARATSSRVGHEYRRAGRLAARCQRAEPDQAVRAVGAKCWQVSGTGLPDLLICYHGAGTTHGRGSQDGDRNGPRASREFRSARGRDVLHAIGCR
jgi:hypothetical protein